uniref:K Homology domain-containing protein n=1 Tax=Meloidogyne incognita TaxID=6306 RepID=A0A914KL16_MELIC
MSVQAIPQSNEENEDLCHQLLTARTVSSVTVGSLEKEDGDTKAEEQQKLPKEVSPTSEQFFTLQSKRFSPSNHPHQQNAVKLEELLSELQQLDLAVRGGALSSDLAHVRALLVHEIHKLHSLLPIYLKRRYASQMPSTMKRIVCVPINKKAFQGTIGQTTGSIPDFESTIGVQARKWSSSNGVGTSSGRTINDKFIREEPEEGNARTVRQRRVVTENEKVKEAAKTDSSASARFRGRSLNHQQQQRLHRRLCASIPSLLEGTKVSYYTDHSCGSACSLMAVGCGGGGGSGGFNNKGYMYPYRCDYAQHVRFENDQYIMQERIYLPENPSFKIIGRILGPRGNSLRQLEAETRCRIVIRGKGSVKDKNKERRLRGLPGWEHLNESLHVMITAQHPDQFSCSHLLHYAVHCIKNLLTPRFDAYKREQLLQLAIINGTYQPRP